MPSFDSDTEITLESSTDTERVWRGHLSPNWSIGPVPNGGYSAALAIRAMLGHTEREIPLSLTTHYHRPTIGDYEAIVRTELVREGRTTSHAEATLTQDGKIRLRCTGVFGSTPTAGRLLIDEPANIPDPEDCVARDPLSQGMNMTLLDSLEMRLHPEALLPRGGVEARIDGWVRFRDARKNDVLALSLFADSFPPAILAEVPETGWVPTLELTTHIRGAAASGWIRGEVTTSNVQGGTVVEDIRLWDQSNTLVVEARQLALLRS